MPENRLESNLRCSSVTVIVGTSFFELFLLIPDLGLVGLLLRLKFGDLFMETFQLLLGSFFWNV